MPKIIVSGGGTGGHVYPALAVAKKLRETGWEVLYVGSKQGLEKEVVSREEIDYQSISVKPFPRQLNLELIKAGLISLGGFIQSLDIIRKYSPDVVFGTGGFVAGPIVLAGTLGKAVTIIHEQNVFPGFTNRFLARVVDRIALNFSDALEYLPSRAENRHVVTGNPVREEIKQAKCSEGLQKLGLKPGKKTLLVFGGSQGARSINEAMYKVCQHLAGKSDIQIIYITGERNYDQVINRLGSTIKKQNLLVKSYMHNIEQAYAVADLIVCRAGATGLAEIMVRGLPAILVPYPHASGDHQNYNAQLMEEKGAGLVITDSNLTGTILLEKISELFSDKNLLTRMADKSKEMGHPRALENLVQEIKSLV